MRILVVDAQGGGLGKALVERLSALNLRAEILAVGTNSAATAAMRKAGANAAATGENAVIYNAHRADIIAGGIGILSANAMMGEVSPVMAAAIGESAALKVLVPYGKCSIRIAGIDDIPLAKRIELAAEEIRQIVESNNNITI